MFSGVSGLRIHQTKMDVIANNISNVNTTGFKSSRTTFAEIFSQTISGASGSNPTTGRGGVNPMQIGLGGTVASIDLRMTIGAAQRTDNPFDLMIQGDGFFIIGDTTGFYFTRAGTFNLDEGNNLVAPNGMVVHGWDRVWNEESAKWEIRKDRVVPISIGGDKQFTPPSSTTKIEFDGNLNAVTDPEKKSSISFYDSIGNRYVGEITFVYDPNSDAYDSNWSYSIDSITYLNGQTDLTQFLSITPSIGTLTFDRNGKLTSPEGGIIKITVTPPSETDIRLAEEAVQPLKEAYETEKDKLPGLTTEYNAAVGKANAAQTAWNTANNKLREAERALNTAKAELNRQIRQWYLDSGIAAEDIPEPDPNVNDGIIANPTGAGVIAEPTGVGTARANYDSIYASINDTDGLQDKFDEADALLNNPANGTPPGALALRDEARARLDAQIAVTSQALEEYSNADRKAKASHFTDPRAYFGDGPDTNVVTIDFSNLTQYGSQSADAKSNMVDGKAPGTLIGVSIGTDGKITGRYSNGELEVLSQLSIANFRNPAGLEKVGDNLFVPTANSGDFDGIGVEIQALGGKIMGGVLEMSNVDLANEFTEMITTQRGFQANSRVITVSDDMLQELVNLKR